jgi:hypothetical protein
MRLFLAAVVLLAGLALMPYVGLPSERFSWQQFVMVYGEQPPGKVYLPIIMRDTLLTSPAEQAAR